jgi:hypothetical protein
MLATLPNTLFCETVYQRIDRINRDKMEKFGVVDPSTTPVTGKTLKTANVKSCGCSLKATKEKERQLNFLDDDVTKRMTTAVASHEKIGTPILNTAGIEHIVFKE